MDIIALTDAKHKPKQVSLIKAAYALFQRHGFHRVSIEEICHTAKVSKMTFYKYYSGKEELVLYIIHRIFHAVEEHAYQILESDLSLKEKLDMVSLAKQEMMQACGEELIRAAISYAPAKAYLEEQTQRSCLYFRNFVHIQREKGLINPHINLDLFLFLLLEINRLFGEDKLKAISSDPQALIRDVNEILVYGLLNRENT